MLDTQQGTISFTCIKEIIHCIVLTQVLQIIPETMFGLLARIIQLQISNVKEVGSTNIVTNFVLI